MTHQTVLPTICRAPSRPPSSRAGLLPSPQPRQPPPTDFPSPPRLVQFIGLLAEAQTRFDVDLWGYCLMGNHWHLVAEVREMPELSAWMHWISTRHVRLIHRERRELGGGHIYQGRFKSFPIQDEVHLYDVLRYVEANPVRASLAPRGRDWLWSSLSPALIKDGLIPVERPRLRPWPRDPHWEEAVDRPISAEKLHRMRQSVARGTPYGQEDWVQRFAVQHGLETTVRRPGRPKKPDEANL